MISNDDLKWILCVGGGRSKITIIEAIKSQNLKCCIIDPDENCLGKNIADFFINRSILDVDKIIDDLHEKKIYNKILGIIPYVSFKNGQYAAYTLSLIHI